MFSCRARSFSCLACVRSLTTCRSSWVGHDFDIHIDDELRPFLLETIHRFSDIEFAGYRLMKERPFLLSKDKAFSLGY
jgi:hypothetical protein